MATKAPDQVFMCPDHQFVIEVVLSRGRLDCHRSPGRRDPSCGKCDEATNAAFNAIGWDRQGGEGRKDTWTHLSPYRETWESNVPECAQPVAHPADVVGGDGGPSDA